MRSLFHLHELVAGCKRTERAGWRERGLAHAESVADHSFGVALLVLLLAEEAEARGEAVDPLAAVRMALLHDLAEAETGDLTPRRRAALFGPDGRVAREAQRAAEERLVERLCAALPAASAARWRADFARYRAGSSPEARLVARADVLECVLQALVYRATTGAGGLEEFHGLTDQIEDRALRAEIERRWAARGGPLPVLRTINPSDPADEALYAAERRLRYRELRLPLGMGFGEEYVPGEERALHLVALLGEEVVGCLLFRRDDDDDDDGGGRIFQMAVAASQQRRGLGRALVRDMEARLAREGRSEIRLHARYYALPFYEKLGYEAEGEPFEEVGLPHRLMRKRLRG